MIDNLFRITGTVVHASAAAGAEDEWEATLDTGDVLGVKSPRLAAWLGADGSGKGGPKGAIDVEATDVGARLFALNARPSSLDLRRARATDVTVREFLQKMAEDDAADAAATSHARLMMLNLKGTSFAVVNEAYEAFARRTDHGSKDWASELANTLRGLKGCAEEGTRQGIARCYSAKVAATSGLNTLMAAHPQRMSEIRFMSRGLAGQTHDNVEGAAFRSALSTAHGVCATMRSWIGAGAAADVAVVEGCVERALRPRAAASRELAGGLTWAWRTLLARQDFKGLARHQGPLGQAVENLEVAIQWIGGDIPDYGPLKGVPSDSGKGDAVHALRATVFQKARGKPLKEIVPDTRGNAVARCPDGEVVVFAPDKSATVYAADGEILFESRPTAPTKAPSFFSSFLR